MKGAVGKLIDSVPLFTLCVPVIVNQDIQWWKIIVKRVIYLKINDEIK